MVMNSRSMAHSHVGHLTSTTKLMNRQLTYISVQAPSQPASVFILQLKHIHDIVVEYVELEKDFNVQSCMDLLKYS